MKNKIIDEWAKENRLDFDCYKSMIKDLKNRIAQVKSTKEGGEEK